MRVGQVVGKVVLSRWHPVMNGATYKIVVPMSLEDLLRGKPGEVEDVVAYDELAAAPGMMVAISEGREAAQPFHPAEKPVDAYVAAILDHLHVEPLENYLKPQPGGVK